MHQFSGSLDSFNYYRNLRKNLHRYCSRKTKSTIKHSLDSFILRNLYLTQTKIPFPFKIRHNSQNIHCRNTYTFPKCIRYKKATKSYFKCDKWWLSLRSTTDTAIPHFPCAWNSPCWVSKSQRRISKKALKHSMSTLTDENEEILLISEETKNFLYLGKKVLKY